MKILYFHQHFSTPLGSTGTRSYDIARQLIERGHQVTMVCGSGFLSQTGLSGAPVKGIRRGNVSGIDVIEICLKYSNYDSLLRRSWTFFRYALTSCLIAWKEDYDLLFATSTPLTAGIPGIVMRVLRPGKRFVFEVRDLWPDLPKAMGVVTNPLVLCGMSLLEKLSYLSMHAGVALSPGIKDGMVRRASQKKPIAMIPNGCNLELFSPAHGSGTSAPAMGFSCPGLGCVFAGAHGRANGLHAVLDAAHVLLRRQRDDIRFFFIGDGKQKPELVQRASDEELTNCHFHEPLPKTQLAVTLRQLDIGLMILENVPAFYYGTSPNKFFDYIASGLPVLVNYPGWLAEIIDEHNCGKTAPPNDSKAFVQTLIELADRPELLEQMGRNGRKLAEEHFSKAKLFDDLVTFLERVQKGLYGGQEDGKSRVKQ